MKPMRIWRFGLLLIIIILLSLTNLSNIQKANMYQFFGRVFSEKISHQTVALPILSIEKTIHSYNGKDSIYLVEYEPQHYVFMQANDDNVTLKQVLEGKTKWIAVKVISRYTKGAYQVQRQFSFSESDIMELPETTRQNLLRSRIVSLTQYDGMNFIWVVVIGTIILVFNIILTSDFLSKRGRVA